jgi:D-glycero-D-manno-heptose 1,7-bisphosphate phosphatase
VSRSAVFLDRDGVLNEAVSLGQRPGPPQDVDQMVIVPGAAEACARLRDAGFLLIVVTNQPDVARGTVTTATIEALHERLRREVPLDDVLVCPHDDADACGCRKPLPGMLVEAARRWSIDLPSSYMVGDRWRDIDAGRAVGCTTVLVEHNWAEKRARGFDVAVSDLSEAAAWILAHNQQKLPTGSV